MDRTSMLSVAPSTVWVRSRLGTRVVDSTPSVDSTVEVSAAVSVCGVTPKTVMSVGEPWFTMLWKEELKENRPTNRTEPTRTQTRSVAAVAAERPGLRTRLRAARWRIG